MGARLAVQGEAVPSAIFGPTLQWLRAVPNGDPKTQLNSSQVKALIKFRLALPQSSFMSWLPRPAGQIWRSCTLMLPIGSLCPTQQCSWAVHAGEAPPLPSGRRADLLVDSLGQGKPLAVDVSCSRPLNPSSSSHGSSNDWKVIQ